MKFLSRVLFVFFILNTIIIISMFWLGSFLDRGVIAYTLRDPMPNNIDAMIIDVRTGVRASLLHGIGEGDVTGRTPIWSDDGESLAFWTFENRRDVFVHEVQLSSNVVYNLTNEQSYFSLPIYGKNNTALFATTPSFTQSQIYLVTQENPQGEIIIESSQVIPVWSPDGQSIAYLAPYQVPEGEDETSIDSGLANEIDIYLTNLETRETINLTLQTSLSGRPIWMPDGSAILFTTFQNGSRRLFEIDLATNEVNRLRGELQFGGVPRISPDGRMLAYPANVRSGNQVDLEVMLFDLETNEEMNLTNSQLYDLDPQWSPDGDQLAFISRRNGSQDEIYIMIISSGHVRRLTFTPEDEADINWQPR